MIFFQKRMTAPLLVLLLCLLLSACAGKDDNTLDAPDTITLGDVSAPSFNVIGAQGGTLTEMTIPAPASVDEDGNEIPAEEGPNVYVYDEVEDAGAAVAAYAQVLLDRSFTVVNAAGKSVEPPDYTAESGYVLLSRASYEFKNTMRFTLSWEPGQCTVKVALLEGQSSRAPTTDITLETANPSPPSEAEIAISQGAASTAPTGTSDTPNESSGGGSTSGSSSTSGSASGSSVAADDVMSFFQTISPAVLGLPGESMELYNIYYLDGMVMVNDSPCGRVRVYVVSEPAGSNAFLGTYLLSGSGRIYEHDTETDQMIELPLS